MGEILFIDRDSLETIANAIREKNQNVDYKYPPMSLEEFEPNIKKDVLLQKYMSGNAISIPTYAIEGIKYVKAECFKNKTNLNSISLPDSVISVGKDAFYNTGFYNNPSYWAFNVLYSGHCLLDTNYNLGSVSIQPGTMLIADNAFEKCTNMSAINIPDSVLYIGNNAFTNTAYFNDENNWDNDVLYIGNYLIKARPSLTGPCKIREGTIAIADYAFENCSLMTAIEIPDSVKNVGIMAFNGCTSITDVTLPASDIWGTIVYNIQAPKAGMKVTFRGGDGVISTPNNADSMLGFESVIRNKNITELIFDEDVREIRTLAFSDNGNITSITFSDSVEYIGYKAFYDTGIQSIVIPDSVAYIGEEAFYTCLKLKSVTIGNGVQYIGDYAFNCCIYLDSIDIPDHGISIGRAAFGSTQYYADENNWIDGLLYIGNHLIKANNTVSGDYVIRDGVTDIAGEAFVNCTELTSITIPSGVEKISNYAFQNCNKIHTAYIPESVNVMNIYAWASCYNLKNVYYGGDITSWCNIQFKNAQASPLEFADNLYFKNVLVHDINIPSTITEIKPYAFCNCRSVNSVTIPDSVTRIGEYAFSNCMNLISAHLGDGIEYIDNCAFYGSTNLNSVNIPASVVEIGYRAFCHIGWNANIYVDCLHVPTAGVESFGYWSNSSIIHVYDQIYEQIINAPNWAYYRDSIVRRT